jgi:hypothetical protein
MPLALQSQFWNVRVAFTTIPLLYSLIGGDWDRFLWLAKRNRRRDPREKQIKRTDNLS